MAIVDKCKLCGQITNLIKSHIIPDSLYRPMFEESGYGYLVTNVENRSLGRLTTGIYDPGLLCEPCERRFSRCDDYGAKFFLKTNWDALPTFNGPNPLAYVLKEFDCHLLKMFCMTVLWRISATSRAEFASVDIGDRLQDLATAILSDNSGNVDDWSVLIARFTGAPSEYPEVDPRHSWLDPRGAQIEGLDCVKIYMAEFMIHVKVDSRAWPDSVRPFCLQNNRPLLVFIKDFANSREFALIAKLARDSRRCRS